MIKHNRQYASSKEWIVRFEQSIAEIRASSGPADRLDDEKRELLARSQEGLRDRLRAEVAEYEALRSGAVNRLSVDSLGSLAEALVKARIAAGLTQRELADRLGISEAEIERDEATDYESATLARVADIAAALDLRITAEIVLPERTDLPGWTDSADETPEGARVEPIAAGE
jgi:ribosome-binding protein aMBF1 (putative translation factor)